MSNEPLRKSPSHYATDPPRYTDAEPRCARCRGTGWIADPSLGGHATDLVPCPDCKGRGYCAAASSLPTDPPRDEEAHANSPLVKLLDAHHAAIWDGEFAYAETDALLDKLAAAGFVVVRGEGLTTGDERGRLTAAITQAVRLLHSLGAYHDASLVLDIAEGRVSGSSEASQ